MAKTTVKELKYLGYPVLVEVAKRDYAGSLIHETYLKKTELANLQAALQEVQETARILENVSSVVASIKDYSGKPLETDADGAVVIDQSVVGLSQVNNTSDENKPLSRAMREALAKKADATLGDENDIVANNDSIAVSAKAINIYVNAIINKLTNGAADALDTLGEISNALNNDANIINSLISSIGGKQSKVLDSAIVVNGIAKDTVQETLAALNNYITYVKNNSAAAVINVEIGEEGNTTTYTSAEAAINAANRYIRTKQDKLEYDTTVTKNSNKNVKSGVIYDYIEQIEDKIMDSITALEGAVDMNKIINDLMGDNGIAIASPDINAPFDGKGWMSREDKQHLDAIYAVFTADDDQLINKIQEVLKLFSEYPDASNLFTLLNQKQPKQLTTALTIGEDTAATVESALSKIVEYIDTLQTRLDAETVKQLIGNAVGTDGNNPAVAGLMSGTDKDRLDALYSLIGEPTGSGAITDGPDQDNIVNKLTEIIEKFSDYYESDGTIKQLLSQKVDNVEYSAYKQVLNKRISDIESKQSETLYVYDTDLINVSVTAEANHIYSYLPATGLTAFTVTIPNLSQFNDYNGLGWSCYFNLSIGNRAISLLPIFTGSSIPVTYFSNGFQVTSITMEAGKLEKLFFDYDGQRLSIFQQEFSKNSVV